MGLPENALTTVGTIADELRLTDGMSDAALERLIGVASDAIETYCDRGFALLAVTEALRPSGAPRLILNRTPVASVESVTDTGVAVSPSEYVLEDAELGYLRREAGWQSNDLVVPGSTAVDTLPLSGKRSLLVAYTAGYVTPAQEALPGTPRTLPFDLEQACIETVVSLWRRRGSDSRASKEFPTGAAGLLPDSVLPILENYRRIV